MVYDSIRGALAIRLKRPIQVVVTELAIQLTMRKRYTMKTKKRTKGPAVLLRYQKLALLAVNFPLISKLLVKLLRWV